MEQANSAALPTVHLEVRPLNGRPTVYEVGDSGFLIGTVPGCDLRLPGNNLPPVLCLISRLPDGCSVRKLAPVQGLSVNGRPANSSYLNDGDTLALKGATIKVSVVPAIGTATLSPIDHSPLLDEIEAHRQQLQAQAESVEDAANRNREFAEELAAREQTLQAAEAELARTQPSPAPGAEHQERAHPQPELDAARLRLYQRYQARRQQLRNKEKALSRGATKLIARKRDLDARTAEIEKSQQDWSLRQAELEARTEHVNSERQLLEDQARELTVRQQELQSALAQRTAEIKEREQRVVADNAALERSQKQHQSDLVRLDRTQSAIEKQRKQLQADALEVDRRFEQLQRDSRELEDQAKSLDEWHQRLTAETERLAAQKQEQDAAGLRIEQRAAAIEGQQAMLATLRTRLERMREELRQQEQVLNDHRVQQEAADIELQQRVQEARQLREELDHEKLLFEEEHKRLETTQATMTAAVAQLRQAQQSLHAEDEALLNRQQLLDQMGQEQAEKTSVLLARAAQLEELQRRFKVDREALDDRAESLSRSEQTVTALQEQLRRRAEALEQRAQGITAQEEQLIQERSAVESRNQILEQDQKRAAEQLETSRLEIQRREEELAKQAKMLADEQTEFQNEASRLKVAANELATLREGVGSDRQAIEDQRLAAQELAARTRAEFQTAYVDAQRLQGQVPDLQARADAALERLNRGREQLRDHLSEIHAYVRQSRDDLEGARKHVQVETERLRLQEQTLHAARDEHRLAAAAFRQQLIEWQGQLGEMKQSLVHGGSQLERRQAEVNAQAQQMADTSAQLAHRAELLEEQERQVAEKRGVMDRHLADMQEWYRHKLRQLAGVDRTTNNEDNGEPPLRPGDVVSLSGPVEAGKPSDNDDIHPIPGHQDPDGGILSLTGDIEPGDRALGELLRSLELMDADTLTTLLLEARRQRRSLRQLLLAGNYLTLYQMALIEARNLDGLVLGPVRVVDRVKSTAHEVVYRVFDPRHNHEALLRHLAQVEMEDAVRPDEFRQRFAAAASVIHQNIAATYEVLEINGRPAVLQEWVRGVRATEWTALAAAPGVWFRLLGQAALALHTAHGAGLVHGHLQPASFVFTREGVLKLCGLGEPDWLSTSDIAPAATVAADLDSLGQLAASWQALAAENKKARPFPPALQRIVKYLTADRVEDRYPNATALLDELDRVSTEVPANAAAWDRFIKFTRDQADGADMKESA